VAIERTFTDRHVGPTHRDEEAMLKSLGYSDLESFISAVVPANIANTGVIEAALDDGVSEVEALAELKAIASKNKVLTRVVEQ